MLFPICVSFYLLIYSFTTRHVRCDNFREERASSTHDGIPTSYCSKTHRRHTMYHSYLRNRQINQKEHINQKGESKVFKFMVVHLVDRNRDYVATKRNIPNAWLQVITPTIGWLDGFTKDYITRTDTKRPIGL